MRCLESLAQSAKAPGTRKSIGYVVKLGQSHTIFRLPEASEEVPFESLEGFLARSATVYLTRCSGECLSFEFVC